MRGLKFIIISLFTFIAFYVFVTSLESGSTIKIIVSSLGLVIFLIIYIHAIREKKENNSQLKKQKDKC